MAKYRMRALDGRLVRTGSKSEAQAIRHFTGEGWQVFKRGWPDFLVVKGGVVRLIEVKGKSKYHLKPQQASIASQLRALGVIVEMWAPDTAPASLPEPPPAVALEDVF